MRQCRRKERAAHWAADGRFVSQPVAEKQFSLGKNSCFPPFLPQLLHNPRATLPKAFASFHAASSSHFAWHDTRGLCVELDCMLGCAQGTWDSVHLLRRLAPLMTETWPPNSFRSGYCGPHPSWAFSVVAPQLQNFRNLLAIISPGSQQHFSSQLLLVRICKS